MSHSKVFGCALTVTCLIASPPANGGSLKSVRLSSVPKPVAESRTAYRLNIPDRKHAPGATPDGWCGESAVQQAMLFHGAFF